MTTFKWTAVRYQRDMLLSEADKIINKASDNGNDTSALRAYRQKLRDIPQQYTDPDAVVWPLIPTE